jgi:hypothetical protein
VRGIRHIASAAAGEVGDQWAASHECWNREGSLLPPVQKPLCEEARLDDSANARLSTNRCFPPRSRPEQATVYRFPSNANLFGAEMEPSAVFERQDYLFARLLCSGQQTVRLREVRCKTFQIKRQHLRTLQNSLAKRCNIVCQRGAGGF